jgi:hypothetical protein
MLVPMRPAGDIKCGRQRTLGGGTMSRILFSVVTAVTVFCSGCASNVVEMVHSPEALSSRSDGALLSYYPPKAQWKFTASYDGSTGLLSLTADPKPTILPDTTMPMRHLSYSHAGLSDDDLDVFFDGLMLKSIATKTSDQTVKVIEAANALLTQAGTAQSAFEKAKKELIEEPGKNLPASLKKANCVTNLKSEITINLSSLEPRLPPKKNDLLWSENCFLQITPELRLLSVRPPFFSSQNLPAMASADAEVLCGRAVCFRAGHVVQLHLTVALLSNSDSGNKVTPYNVMLPSPVNPTKRFVLDQDMIPVTVPSSEYVAYVEFSRRAFVENHTTIAFADGVLSEFHSTDPSIVTGAVTLVNDLLKSVVLTVPLVR